MNEKQYYKHFCHAVNGGDVDLCMEFADFLEDELGFRVLADENYFGFLCVLNKFGHVIFQINTEHDANKFEESLCEEHYRKCIKFMRQYFKNTKPATKSKAPAKPAAKNAAKPAAKKSTTTKGVVHAK